MQTELLEPIRSLRMMANAPARALLAFALALPDAAGFAQIQGAGQAVGAAASEPLECRLLISHTVPSTVCRPFDSNPSPVRALIRKMPAWSGNSDLLLIDMCSYTPEGFALSEEQVTVSQDGKLPDTDPRLKPIQCVRRYCTEKYNAFSIAINALPIPIGWVAIKIWIGFGVQNFEVSCANLSTTPPGGER